MKGTELDDEEDRVFFQRISIYSLQKAWNNKYDERWDEVL